MHHKTMKQEAHHNAIFFNIPHAFGTFYLTIARQVIARMIML